MSDTPASGRDGGSSSNTRINALVGGVATVVLSFVPFSPVLGGGLAGYLEGEDTDEGLRVGVYAGLVALVPFVLFFLLFGGLFMGMVGMSAFGMPRAGMVGAVGGAFLLVVIVFGLLYTVGLSAVGGLVGAYLHRELD